MARVRESLLIIVLAFALPSAAQAAATRIAVIGDKGESTLADFVVPTIEAGLTKESQVTLVERALIRKVLAEQQLSAAGLMEPGKAIQVGRILGVDMFLIVDAPPPLPETFAAAKQTLPPTCRIRAVEARTGMVLCSCMLLQQTLTNDISGVTSLIDLASRKLSYPPNNRRYVALLVVRSEALDGSLDSLAGALSMFLLNDLANSPNVIVLERERLEHLTAEKALVGADVELQTSAVLLKGGIAYGATRHEVVATISFQTLKGGNTEYLHVNGPLENLAGLRAQLVNAVAEKLNAEPTGPAQGSPREEAVVFRNRALHECELGPEGVIPNVEAAVALDPSPETLDVAKQMYSRVARWYASAFSNPALSREAVTQAEIAGLKERVRFQETEYRIFRNTVLNPPKEGIRPTGGFLSGDRLTVDLLGSYGTAVRNTGSTEARELYQEFVQLWLREYRESLAIATENCRKALEAYDWVDLLTLRLMLAPLMAADDDQWLADIQAVVRQVENPPPGVPRMPAWLSNYTPLEGSLYFCFPQQLKFAQPDFDWKTTNPSVQRLFDWLMSRPDPVVKILACAAAFGEGWGCTKDAETSFRILASELPPILPGEKENPFAVLSKWVFELGDPIFFWTYRNDPDLLVKYGNTIFRPMLRREHAAMVSTWGWQTYIGLWLSALEHKGRYQEAYEIAKEFQDTVNVAFPPNLNAREAAKRHIDRLEIQLGLASPPPAPEPPPPDLRPVPFVAKLLTTETGYRINAIQPDGNRAILLESGRDGDKGDRVRLVAVPLDGGNRSILGEITLKPMAERNLRCTVVLTRDETGQWLASMCDIGIVTFEKGRTKLWTEADGLPSLKLESLACLNGKWYLGMSPGAIIEFDPQTGRSVTLCSCLSEAPQNLFDGPPMYNVPFLLSDPVRNCIWIGINHTWRDDRRPGLWRFDAASRKISFASERLPRLYFDNDRWDFMRRNPDGVVLLANDYPANARWCFNRILIRGVGLYDPATDSVCYLTEHAYTRPKEDPWPCGPGGEYWPVGLFGDRIVAKPDSRGNWVKIAFFEDQPPLSLRAQDIEGNLLVVECMDAVVIAGEDSSQVVAIRDKEGGAPSFERLVPVVKRLEAEAKQFKEQMKHPPPKPGPDGKLVPQRAVISFDEKGGGITVQYNPVLNMTKAMTVEAWIWADDPAQGVIMSRDTPKLGPWQLLITRDGKLESDVAPYNWRSSPESTHYPLPTKTWLHIAMVFDGSELRNYINGHKVSACAAEPQITTNDNDLRIGRRFNGWIAGARLSNEALYKEDFTPPARLTKLPSTVILLPLDEGQGIFAEDESGNGCVAVIANGTWITVAVDEFQINPAAPHATSPGSLR